MKKYLLFFGLSLALSACNIGAKPPQDSSALSTAAAQTVQAILVDPAQSAETATSAPPLPQPTATLAPEASPSPTVCKDNAVLSSWLRDNRPYDKQASETPLAPSKGFLMTWHILNEGDCVWNDAYRFNFASGERLTAQDSIPVMPTGYLVNPGETLTINLQMSAPAKNGTYESSFEFINEAGSAILSMNVSTVVGQSAPANTSIAAPGNLRYEYDCSNGYTSITLYWSDKATNEEGYRISRDGAQIAQISAGSTSYNDIAPASGSYLYAVSAYNASGESAASLRVETTACQ
ncbi:MAG: hypothetical protein LC099_03855 [Anaerolineales bacterium]|nr:hypothetical protein [Anaerolineales bacterium]